MTTLREIEDAVTRLSDEDRVAFRTWFAEFDADQWDRQIEADFASGRLDRLLDEARQDLRSGRCSDR